MPETPNDLSGQIIAGNTWNELQQLIIFRLNDNAREVAACREELMELRKEISTNHASMKVDIAMLQVKSGVWGAIGGMVPVLVALLVWMLTGHK